LTGFDIPPGTNFKIPGYVTLGNPTPNNLYPTDVYTLEYDGWADFPHYPIDVLSDLNAVVGMHTQHLAYLGLDPNQITNAIALPATGNTLVNYYMIASQNLPILDPVRLIPIVGQPVYDLLEPDTRILVDLGYGSINEGWNQGPANVETPIGLFPTGLDWSAVLPALGTGAQQGVTAFVNDLLNPNTYRITPLVDNPSLTTLIAAAYGAGDINNPHPSSLWDLLTSWVTTPPESS
jgi:PE-PPE domain